jgi:hypothetical protein
VRPSLPGEDDTWKDCRDMTMLLGGLLALAALTVLAYPILRRNRSVSPAGITSAAPVGSQPNQEQLDELLARRELALQALRELSFDKQVGKISEEDFDTFETNLKLSAAGTFRALDEWEAEADRQLGPTLIRDYTIRLESLKQGAVCLSCGRRAGANDRFCAGCGASLPSQEIVPVQPAALMACTYCGRPAEPGDRFCGGCGRPLATQVAGAGPGQPNSASAN